MRYVQIQEVGMQNYGLYIEPMVLEFENDTITLIVGPNGTGKTMMIDAIPFTFYGITSKGARGDDVVNSTVGKNCKTWVKFLVDDDEYIVTRYHKYSKLGNTVILTKNGEDIKKGHREVLPVIEKLICSQRTFTNTLMFGQKVKDFFTDLTDSERKEIFKQILNLDNYGVYYKLVDERLREERKKRDSLLTEKEVNQKLLQETLQQVSFIQQQKKEFYDKKKLRLHELQGELDRLTKQKEQLEQTYQSFKSPKEQETLFTNLSELKQKYEQLNSICSQKCMVLEQKKNDKLLRLQQEKSESEKHIQEQFLEQEQNFRERIRQLQNTISEEKQNVQSEINNIFLQNKQFESQISSLQERINEIQSKVIETDVSTCPLCEQEVNRDTKEMLEQKVVTYQEKCIQLQVEIDSNVSKVRLVKEESKEKLRDLTSKISDLETRITELKQVQRKELQELEKRLQQATSKVYELFKQEKSRIVGEVEAQKQILRGKIEELETTVRQIREQEELRKQTEEDLKQVSNQILSLTREKQLVEEQEFDDSQYDRYIKKKADLETLTKQKEKEVEETEHSIEVFTFWKEAFSFSGIPSMLIDEAIPFINNRISDYLDLLTNGRFIVSVDTISQTKSGDYREKIAVNVVDTTTKANSRVQLSGGQTRIIDIAMILTLGDLQSLVNDVKFNFLLFDEIFDSLDDENTMYVCNVLKKISGKAIFIIAHQHQDQLEADKVLSL